MTMKTIYKYPLAPHPPLELPKNAEVLTVQTQCGAPMMWVLLDPEAPTVSREFDAYPTGGDIDPVYTKGEYIGTFQAGGEVFHVFES
jgi:hypothetical protein